MDYIAAYAQACADRDVANAIMEDAGVVFTDAKVAFDGALSRYTTLARLCDDLANLTEVQDAIVKSTVPPSRVLPAPTPAPITPISPVI